MKNLNKNISVWRGSNTPPTDYHLWVKDDGSIWIRLTDAWSCIATVQDSVKIDDLSQKIEQLWNIHIEQNTELKDGVRRSYSLKFADGQLLGDDIDIPSVNELQDVKIGYSNASVSKTNTIDIGYSQHGESPSYMLYLLSDGQSYRLVSVLLPSQVAAGEGILIEDNKVSIRIDEDSSSHLSVSDKGLKFTDYEEMSIEDIENKFNS